MSSGARDCIELFHLLYQFSFFPISWSKYVLLSLNFFNRYNCGSNFTYLIIIDPKLSMETEFLCYYYPIIYINKTKIYMSFTLISARWVVLKVAILLKYWIYVNGLYVFPSFLFSYLLTWLQSRDSDFWRENASKDVWYVPDNRADWLSVANVR